jgi:hypothetical protein
MNWEVFNTSTEINTHISEISDIFKEAVSRSSNSEELIVAIIIFGSLKSWLRLVFITISGRTIFPGRFFNRRALITRGLFRLNSLFRLLGLLRLVRTTTRS